MIKLSEINSLFKMIRKENQFNKKLIIKKLKPKKFNTIPRGEEALVTLLIGFLFMFIMGLVLLPEEEAYIPFGISFIFVIIGVRFILGKTLKYISISDDRI